MSVGGTLTGQTATNNGGKIAADVNVTNLATGASTSALQTTGNTSLSDIDTSTTALGAKTDAKNSATDTTSVSIVSVLKEISSLAQVVGQTTMSASTPVVIASDQTSVSVIPKDGSGNVTPASDVASRARYIRLSDGNNSLGTAAGIPVIVCAGTSSEIQGNVVVTGTTSSNLTFTMADGTTFTAKAANRIELHSYQIVNSGATNALITFTMDNSVPTTLGYGVAPTSTTPFGGSNVALPAPMFTTVQNKAMSIQAGGSSSSIYVTAQGCIVP
jgi:hypothetical protein